MKKIAQGAEAILHDNGNEIIKNRFEKTYRHPILDRKLRKSRTKREAKVLETLEKENFPAPRLKNMDDKEMQLIISKIDGVTIKEKIDELEEKNSFDQINEICKEIGELLAKLHNIGIIHQDMTTSNMMINNENTIHFIDFGLSFYSEKTEDKAVDLHLLRRAMESRHHRIFEECFKIVLDNYLKNVKNSKEIENRFNKVEMRGRNKGK